MKMKLIIKFSTF